MNYPEELCKPMREELTNAGFQELKTVEDVDALFKSENETFLIFIKLQTLFINFKVQIISQHYHL